MIKRTSFSPVTRFDSARSFGGRGWYWSTLYLVDGMLIDTGCAHAAGELLTALRDEPVHTLVNTHTHEDHIGTNGDLQAQRDGLKILAHPLALPVLADPRQVQPLQRYRRTFWGWPKPSTGSPLRDGDTVETEHYAFKVIYTPGHSPDHLCLYEQDNGWLFTGDLYSGGQDRALREGCDIWQIIESLKRVAALPLNRMYPGSARVREDPVPALTAKIAYLEETGGQVLDLHRRGMSPAAIARTLFGGLMLVEAVTLGHFGRLQLVRSYLENSKVK